jgi:hypothetical protein
MASQEYIGPEQEIFKSKVIPPINLNIPMPHGATVPRQNSEGFLTGEQKRYSKDWVRAVRTDFQHSVISFLLGAYGISLAATLGIFLLQGFHVWGFNLDHDFVQWLGVATVGQVLGLLVLGLRAVFRS